jgi:hypothetical protein
MTQFPLLDSGSKTTFPRTKVDDLATLALEAGADASAVQEIKRRKLS